MLQLNRWAAKQKAASPSRYYGDGGTIHNTGYVDVEVHQGEVVAVWFRCQPMAFQVAQVSESRANEMKSMYQNSKMPRITGIECLDEEQTT